MDGLSKTTTWRAEHAGIPVSITFWGEGSMCDGAGMWNYYLHLTEDMLSAEDFAKVWLSPVRWLERSNGRSSPFYDEHGSILDDADFHGGITFYEKREAVDGGPRSIKAGCDYGHLWDREAGYPATLESVWADAQRSAEALAKVLRVKRRCAYNGRYVFQEEGIESEGRFYSPEGFEQREAWLARQNAA